MNQSRRHWHQLAAALLAIHLGTTTAAATPLDAEDTAAIRDNQGQLTRIFALPATLAIDSALRIAASEIAAAHLQRTESLLTAWLEEEREQEAKARAVAGVAAGAAAGSTTGNAPATPAWPARYALMARLLNELALWHLEPGDADYERATLDAIKDAPLSCKTGLDARFGDYARRIRRIQAMPPALRQAALASEARLLEHWGKPRAALPPWPTPLPQEAARDVAVRIAAGGKRPAVALPPVVAWPLVADVRPYDELQQDGKCAVQRWYLLESLAQGQSPATVLNAFRYGTLVTATVRFGAAFEQPEDAAAGQAADAMPPFPKLAARFDATGTTTVSRRFNAAGQPEQAGVIDRRITVAGIRGVRPVAFEDVFDKVSIQYALKPVAAGAKPVPKFQLAWTLPADQAAQAPQEQKR